jgi:hypothetical protein
LWTRIVGSGLGSQSLAIGLSFHDEMVSVVGEPVQCGVGHDRGGEERKPVGGWTIRSEHDRAAQVALGDDLVAVLGLDHGERFQAEIIEDEEIRGEQPPDLDLPGVIGARAVQCPKAGARLQQQHRAPEPTGMMSKGLSKMGLPGAGRAIEQHMLAPLDEESGGENRARQQRSSPAAP